MLTEFTVRRNNRFRKRSGRTIGRRGARLPDRSHAPAFYAKRCAAGRIRVPLAPGKPLLKKSNQPVGLREHQPKDILLENSGDIDCFD
jgi:hypothetical protein